MNKRAYELGRRHALEKFGGASAAPAANDGASAYRDSGSPWPTVTADPNIRSTNINQNFAYNASLGPTSGMTDPGFTNNVLRGGTPTIHPITDTTGGLA